MIQLYVQALLKLGLCDLIEGNFSGAEDYISQVEREAIPNGLIYEQVWCSIGRARIALSRHQFDQAQAAIIEILEASEQRNMAWIKLRGLHFCAQLHKATREPSLIHYEADYQALIEMLSRNAQSDALRSDFEKAKHYWAEGHAYP